MVNKQIFLAIDRRIFYKLKDLGLFKDKKIDEYVEEAILRRLETEYGFKLWNKSF